MTAINIATQIPSQIDSLEKLAVWCGLALGNRWRRLDSD